jgi:hypothetical protein
VGAAAEGLLRIVTERALAATLDEETVVALDKYAYAVAFATRLSTW